MICLTRIDPMRTPKCYTWLESYGSPLSDGKKKKYLFHPVKRQIFGDASGQTSALILTVFLTSSSGFRWLKVVVVD